MPSCWTHKGWSANYHSMLQVTNLRKKSTKKTKKQQQQKKIKIKISLTRSCTKINYAHETTNENTEIINFTFADPNENLKFS